MSKNYKTHTNSYFTHRSVVSSAEASILSNEQTWTIFEVIRDSGAKGLTPPEVVEEAAKIGEHISRSKAYAILKRLYEYGWIHRYYDSEVKSQRNTISDFVGPGSIDEYFADIVEEKMSRYIETHLFPIFDKFFQETVQKLEDDPEVKKWLPDRGKNSFCRFCKINHESEEFVNAIILVAVSSFIVSQTFEKSAIKKRFAAEDFEASE